MDFKLFLLGLAFLLSGYIIYRYLLKNKKPPSEETHWEGMTGTDYAGLLGGVILCFTCGILLIIKSLPSEIEIESYLF